MCRVNSYQGAWKLGYTHVVSSISASDEPAHVLMPPSIASRRAEALAGRGAAWHRRCVDGHVLACGECDGHALVRLRPDGCGYR